MFFVLFFAFFPERRRYVFSFMFVLVFIVLRTIHHVDNIENVRHFVHGQNVECWTNTKSEES